LLITRVMYRGQLVWLAMVMARNTASASSCRATSSSCDHGGGGHYNYNYNQNHKVKLRMLNIYYIESEEIKEIRKETLNTL